MVRLPTRLDRSFFDRGTLLVCRELLGKSLVRLDDRGRRVSGLVIEAEAYIGMEDLGCHAHAGRTARNASMWGPPGHAYVYFTYGMHWMLNFVTEREGFPAAVLIRGVAPVEGLRAMRRRRKGRPLADLANGPAKLCQAFRRQYDCNFISAMPTNLYGPYDNFNLQSSHVLPAMIRKFHLAKLAWKGDLDGIHRDEALFGPIPQELNDDLLNPASRIKETETVMIWGSGTPRREFLRVDDLADACFFLMRHYNDVGHINIGTGEDLTIRELAELIRAIVFPQTNLVFDATKPDGTPQKLLDVTRLHQLGWNYRIDFKTGIEDVY